MSTHINDSHTVKNLNNIDSDECSICGKDANKKCLPFYNGHPAKTDYEEIHNHGYKIVCEKCYQKYSLDFLG